MQLESYVFNLQIVIRLISRILYFLESSPRIRGKAINWNIAYWKSCPKYSVLSAHCSQLNMGYIRKRRWREGLEGQSVEGGDYFKYFRPSKGDDYSRKEINQGTAIRDGPLEKWWGRGGGGGREKTYCYYSGEEIR